MNNPQHKALALSAVVLALLLVFAPQVGSPHRSVAAAARPLPLAPPATGPQVAPAAPLPPPLLSGVAFSPPTSGPGATLILTYTISAPVAQQVLLGGSIAPTGSGNWLDDTPHDLIVNVPAGTSTFSRLFVISPYVTAGAYDIQWGLWDAGHTVRYDYWQQNAVLTLQIPQIQSMAFGPPAAGPGATLVFTYTISSPATADYVPGASIAPTGSGNWMSDPANDPVITFSPGITTVSRIFVIPPAAAPGIYDVAWGLWDSTHTVQLDYHQQNGVLTVTNGTPIPTRTATPTRTVTVTPTATLTAPASATLVPTNTPTGGPPPPSPTRSPVSTPTGGPPAATGTATASPAVSVTPTACPVEFIDVPPDNAFYAYVRCLACRGIVGGYPCGQPGEPCPGLYFRPGNQVTRGQVAKIVAESAGFSDPVPSTQWTFEDVPPGSTFALWVERIAGRGYIGGYPCGGINEPCQPPADRPYYRPANNVTRGQMAKIVSNTAQFTETPLGQTFQDVPPDSTFYLWVQRVAERSILGGYPCGQPSEPCVAPENRSYYRPNNNVTRGQTSKIVGNAFFPGCAPPAR